MAARTPEHNERIRQALLARGAGQTPTKVCSVCGKEKDRAKDYRTRTKKGRTFTRSECRACEAWLAQQYREGWDAERRQRAATQNRATQFRQKYGITIEEYEALLETQEGRCRICRREGPGISNRKFMFVDHDHQDGHVRGLLCSRCNTGLGMFEDDPTRLQAAIDYLKESQR